MRMRLLALTGIALLACASSPAAQGPPASNPDLVGSFDVGGRVSTVDGDEARFQRYRDFRDGPFLENFRYNRDKGSWLFNAKFGHVGYRDQRYEANFTQFGKLKTSFSWDQIPLFYSRDTRTLYAEVSPGVLRLDDAIQNGTTPLAVAAPLAGQFDLRQRRDTARFGLAVTPTKNLDLTANVQTAHRDGHMPWSGTFGFGNTVEVAAPLDHRTTDLNAAAEWGNDRGSVRLQYDGSWFNNNVQTLIWDNPLVATDTLTGGSLQGRAALWPTSTMNTVSATGSKTLPARSRATAYVSVGAWNQDEALLPFTINSAIPAIPLPRTTAQANADVTAVNLNFTSRPVNRVWINLRYRRYDFDNKTPEFHVTSTVTYDQNLTTAAVNSEPFGYVRNWLDADASYDLASFAALRVGYGLETVERTFRFIENTTEHAIRASIDSTGNNYVSVRGVYEHSKRAGSGLDEEVLDDIGEQISLRQFDISDRDRDRLSTIVQVTPVAMFGINGTIGAGRDKRPNAYFGLQEAQTRFYSVGLDVTPNNTISAGFVWGLDRYTSVQRSRQANPGVQFNDPTRDWSTDAADRVHYLDASVDLVKAIPKTDLRFAYDFNRSRSRYVYLLPTNSTLVAPQQLPVVVNALHRATVDLKYLFATHLAGGFGYWFDKYDVDDFALGTQTLTRINMPSALLLGNVWRPYTGHTVWGRLFYLW